MTDLTKVPNHAAAIHKAGGPKWYEWCELYKHKQPYSPDDWVEEMRVWSHDACDAIYNHEACEAAVIAYAGEVRGWWLRKGYWSSVSPDEGTEQWETVVDCDNPLERGRFVNYFDTQLAASVALIEAVAGEVGG